MATKGLVASNWPVTMTPASSAAERLLYRPASSKLQPHHKRMQMHRSSSKVIAAKSLAPPKDQQPPRPSHLQQAKSQLLVMQIIPCAQQNVSSRTAHSSSLRSILSKPQMPTLTQLELNRQQVQHQNSQSIPSSSSRCQVRKELSCLRNSSSRRKKLSKSHLAVVLPTRQAELTIQMTPA